MATSKFKKSAKFWKTDWFVGLIVVLAVLVFAKNTSVFDRLELQLYDSGVAASDKKPSTQIAVIAIDDVSVENIGRWPWPRETQAKLIEKISAAKPKVILNTVLYSEPQLEPGLEYVRKMKVALAADQSGSSATAAALGLAEEAERELDGDKRLAANFLAAGNVTLGVSFGPGEQLGKPDKPLSVALSKHVIGTPPDFAIPVAKFASEPLDVFAASAVGVGHLNFIRDVSGTVRSEALLVDYYGKSLGSMSLVSVLKFLNLTVADVKADPLAEVLTVGKLKIATNSAGEFRPYFYRLNEKDKTPFSVDSAHDVLSGKIQMSKYAGKLVIFGPTAAGLGNEFAAPGGRGMAPPELLAHTTSSLLSEHFVKTPLWASTAVALALLLVAAYLLALLPRLSAQHGAIITGVLLVALLGTEYLLLSTQLTWLQLVLPAGLLLIGHLALTTKRFLVTEEGKVAADEKSAETSRMMGLAEQGQGRPDLAFDWFRKVPLNETHGPVVMDNLYNLALDFERKRQFNKAQAVYEYMSAFDKGYKDLSAKLNRAKNLSETVILGGGGSHPGGTLVLDNGAVEKPMLGRYQVEKELGKGAMGVVYLGKDPKIGRVVAIKTMALSNEFEGDELVDARERFFREAETAGRLQHQNIVTIFDAGEEHDLAYIAMEFLKGKDLLDFTKHGALLPVATVVSICARVAEALAYAHTQNVVHRDIKPANIMYDMGADVVKVTDFGIARITDSSKTKTGLVLGTPSFMSPEQLAGKKVDGRSDLYSLGVMLFQMLVGVLPFRGESMAELMFKIANEEALDIRVHKPDLPEALAHVVALALSKRPETRYQTGDQFAIDLRAAATAPAGGLAAGSPSASLSTIGVTTAPVDNSAMNASYAPSGHAQATQAFVRTDAQPAATFDKTEVYSRPGVEVPPAMPQTDHDPFEKTMVSAPRKPAAEAE